MHEHGFCLVLDDNQRPGKACCGSADVRRREVNKAPGSSLAASVFLMLYACFAILERTKSMTETGERQKKASELWRFEFVFTASDLWVMEVYDSSNTNVCFVSVLGVAGLKPLNIYL